MIVVLMFYLFGLNVPCGNQCVIHTKEHKFANTKMQMSVLIEEIFRKYVSIQEMLRFSGLYSYNWQKHVSLEHFQVDTILSVQFS